MQLDHGECAETIVLQLEDSLGIIERSGPLQSGIGWNWRDITVFRIAGHQVQSSEPGTW